MMFDKRITVINQEAAQPSHVTVHEHRAPTDDSIRLAGEYEEKALRKVIASYKLDTNTVKGHSLIVRSATTFDTFIIISRVKVNGTDYEIQEEIDGMIMQRMLSRASEFQAKIVKLWGDAVANEVIKQALEQESELGSLQDFFKATQGRF
jgi:hypothetical protein